MNTASVNNHRNLMQNENLQHCLEVALAEFVNQNANSAPEGNFNLCAAAHIQIQGAIQFIKILKNLGERTIITPVQNRDNLEQQ